jgi:uncharacterized protein DUF3850
MKRGFLQATLLITPDDGSEPIHMMLAAASVGYHQLNGTHEDLAPSERDRIERDVADFLESLAGTIASNAAPIPRPSAPGARMLHQLKTVEPYWTDVYEGRKTFEVRRNDRRFQVGDVLELQNAGTGRAILREIGYILRGGQFGLDEGFVVLGLLGLPQTQIPLQAALSVTLPKSRP